jgi:hypothetical protein
LAVGYWHWYFFLVFFWGDELLDCRLAAVAEQEQDHQLRGAIFFERKCCLLAPCQHQHMQKKTNQYRRFLPV